MTIIVFFGKKTFGREDFFGVRGVCLKVLFGISWIYIYICVCIYIYIYIAVEYVHVATISLYIYISHVYLHTAKNRYSMI